jgi:hypothetical protein
MDVSERNMSKEVGFLLGIFLVHMGITKADLYGDRFLFVLQVNSLEDCAEASFA